LRGITAQAPLSEIRHELPRGIAADGVRQVWDVFVCHATEDKQVVARPLADRLRELA
jgi:hypothetical protein